MKYPKQLKLSFCIEKKCQRTSFEKFLTKNPKITVQRSEQYGWRGGIVYLFKHFELWNDNIVWVTIVREDEAE